MANEFALPAYASTHPAIAQLFANEFAQRQAGQQAQQEAAKNALLGQQVEAQSKLAQAQLRAANEQQQYNNLFRIAEFKDRQASGDEQRKLFTRQLDIDEKARVPRTDLEAKRREAVIIDSNAAAINDAQRANALFKISFDKLLSDEKQKRSGFLWTGWGATAGRLDDPKSPEYRAIQNQAFNTVRNQLLAEKGGALNSLIPDADTFTFKPVQYDETGKAIALPLPSPAPTSVMPNQPPTGSQVPFTMTPPQTQEAPPSSLDTLVGSSIFNMAIPRFSGATAAPMPSVHVPVRGGTLEMSSQVASEIEQQLRGIAPEFRAAAASTLQDQLLKSGRARLISEIPELRYGSPVY